MNPPFRVLLVLLLSLLTPIQIALADNLISVGVIASLTDEWAAMGESVVNGAQLVCYELNAATANGSPRVQLIVEDSKEANSGAGAVTAYRSLRQRGIKFFLGPLGTPAGMSLAPIAAKDPVILITPTIGIPDFSEASPNLFNTHGVDEKASRAMATIAIRTGWKHAAVLASQQPWESAQGRAFRDEFERRGGTIVSYQEPLPDVNDFKGLVTKIIAARPEVVFLANFNRLAIASRQLAALGYHGPKLAALLTSTTVEQAGAALEGAIYATVSGVSTAFEDKYERRFGKKPEYGADASYDALHLLFKALSESVSPDPNKIAHVLSTLRTDKASGEISFDGIRVAKRPLRIFEVKKGKISIRTGDNLN